MSVFDKIRNVIYEATHHGSNGAGTPPAYAPYFPGEYLLPEEQPDDLSDWEILPAESPATQLPEGWIWTDYGDGSGHLQDPSGNQYFSYDRQPYVSSSGIEYKVDKDDHYTVYWGSMDDFKEYAESYMKYQYLPTHDWQNADHNEPNSEISADKTYEAER